MRVMEERRAGPVRSTPNAAKRFADALLGRTPTHDVRPTGGGGTLPPGSERSRLVEHFRWLMAIVPSRAGLYQQQLEERLAEEASRQSEPRSFAELILETEWDASKHPRRSAPPNGGWFADKGTGTTANGGAASGSPRSVAAKRPVGLPDSPRKGLLAAIGDRNRQLNSLTGGSTQATKQAQGLAADIEAAGAAAAGFNAGLKTGAKAVINGGATAVKNVATLGLSTSQLELIGVTDEDRANGYDTAVAIATASGELLITVVTGGAAAALSKGGTVARAASGALVAYDTAGNAVGVVQGIYDAKTNGVSVRNAASVTANALGLTANVRSLGDLAKGPSSPKARPVPEATPEEVDAFVSTLPRKKTPTSTPANQYEIKYTGADNYTIAGGGTEFDMDGFDHITILEAKHVGNKIASPCIPNSTCPPVVRKKILDATCDELTRLRTIIESGETPFRSVRVITNTEESKAFFERLLKEYRVPGTVILAI